MPVIQLGHDVTCVSLKKIFQLNRDMLRQTLLMTKKKHSMRNSTFYFQGPQEHAAYQNISSRGRKRSIVHISFIKHSYNHLLSGFVKTKFRLRFTLTNPKRRRRCKGPIRTQNRSVKRGKTRTKSFASLALFLID